VTYPHQDLGPEAWTLLGFVHRHTQGSPRPPDNVPAYETLIARCLIERCPGSGTWMITEEGDRLLRARYAGSK